MEYLSEGKPLNLNTFQEGGTKKSHEKVRNVRESEDETIIEILPSEFSKVLAKSGQGDSM